MNMKIDYYETKFKEYGWNKYLPNLYKWQMEDKDIKELVNLIVKIEEEKNPLPNIKADGKIELKCDVRGCDVNAPESTNIFIGAPKGFKPMYDGKRAWTEPDILFDDEEEQD